MEEEQEMPNDGRLLVGDGWWANAYEETEEQKELRTIMEEAQALRRKLNVVDIYSEEFTNPDKVRRFKYLSKEARQQMLDSFQTAADEANDSMKSFIKLIKKIKRLKISNTQLDELLKNNWLS